MKNPALKTDRLELKRLAGTLSLAFAAWALPSTAVMAQASAAPDAALNAQRAGVAWDTFAHRNVQYLAQASGSTAQATGSTSISREERLLAALKAETVVPVKVGEIELKIPVPPGHVRVSPDMEEMHAGMMYLTQGGSHRHLITFMPVDQALEALGGDIPALTSAFTVEVPRELENRTSSAHDFIDTKITLHSRRDQIVQLSLAADRKRADQQAQGTARDGGGMTAESTSVLEKNVHFETPRMIAFSSLTRVRDQGAGRAGWRVTGARTTGFVLVNGKLLRLITTAQGDEAERLSQAAWQQWGEQILASNPNGARANAANSPVAGASKNRGMSSSLTADSSDKKQKDGYWTAMFKDIVGVLGMLVIVAMAYRLWRWRRE